MLYRAIFHRCVTLEVELRTSICSIYFICCFLWKKYYFRDFYNNFEFFEPKIGTNSPKYCLRCCILLYFIVLYLCEANWGHPNAVFTLFIDFYKMLTIFGIFNNNFEFFQPKIGTKALKYCLRCCIRLYFIGL